MPAAVAAAGYNPAQLGLGGPASAQPTAQAVPMIPFDQASHRGEEPGRTYGFTQTAAQQQFGPDPIPATGFLRFVKVEFLTGTAGTGGTGRADFPFNLVALLRLQDTNGAPLYELTGYNAFVAMTYGAFAGNPDPRVQPDYSATTTSPAFTMRIPVEIQPDGFGALANLSAASAYRLTIIMDTLTNSYSVSPSPVPIMTISVFCEFWTVPSPVSMLGQRQTQAPPFSGSVQLWTQQPNISVNVGQNVTTVNRVGNMLRTLAWIARTSAFVRTDTQFPTPFTLKWDDRDLIISDATQFRMLIRELTDSLSARDTGVYVFQWSYGRLRWAGSPGFSSWVPSVTSTRLQLLGATAVAGTLDLIINDVSVTPQQPAVRASEGGLGYHPPVSPSAVGAL